MTDATLYPHLFSPGRIGTLTIPNRIVQLPMGSGMIENGRITPADSFFVEERAIGGVGLIITGAAAVHATTQFPIRVLLEAWDESMIESMTTRVRGAQQHGARIFSQLIHLGREFPGGLGVTAPMSPSPIASPRSVDLPHEMTTREIRMIVEAFGRSARNCQRAGYDGIEISGGHGYLVAQFLSTASNKRLDAYRGDTTEGRTRFLVEVIEEIRLQCGEDYPLGVRLSADEQTADGLTLEDTLEIVDQIQVAAPVDYLSITAGMRSGYVKDSSWNEGFALDLAEAVKQGVDIPVIGAGRIRQPELAERAIANGEVDFIGLGRALIADAEWANKARDGRSAQIRPCIGLVQDCRRGEGLLGCAINARTGHEAVWPLTRRRAPTKRIVIAGAGPGGLEMARIAKESGHDVVIFEQSNRTGGQLRTAASGPTREELADFIFYLERELKRLGVAVQLETTATAALILEQSPDLVVVATGATPTPPRFNFDDTAHVVNVWELLNGRVATPARAIVLDDATGFWHGVSAAEYLAERGASVELMTPARGVGLAIPHESVARVLQRLRSNGVGLRELVNVASVQGTTVTLSHSVTGEPAGSLDADLVVVRTNLKMNDALAHELEGKVAAIASIGDSVAPRRLSHAVADASLVLHAFEAGTLTSSAMVPF
ncbi:MAG: oxidoreductase [Acidimicrobiales bacterium]